MSFPSLYRISWLSSAGAESSYESDPYDALTIARANDGIITFDGEDYTADEMEARLNSPDYDKELEMEFPWAVQA